MSTRHPVVLQCIRQSDEWIVRSHRGPGADVHSDALDVTVSLDAVYALVDGIAADADVASPSRSDSSHS